MDVIQRLESAVVEMERERECVCVVAHQAVLRAVYGYFTKAPPEVSVPSWVAMSVLHMCHACAHQTVPAPCPNAKCRTSLGWRCHCTR